MTPTPKATPKTPAKSEKETKTDAAAKLQTILDKMGVAGKATLASTDPVTVEVKTEDPAELIGHRGEGIRALQHLLRLMLFKDDEDSRAIVDIDGYRERQHAQLQDLAKRKAEEVEQTGRLAVLPPMSSYERRLVHVALADAPGIVTESLGEGQNRRVMIKKKP